MLCQQFWKISQLKFIRRTLETKSACFCFRFSLMFCLSITPNNITNIPNSVWKSHRRHKCSLKRFRMSFSLPKTPSGSRNKNLNYKQNHITAGVRSREWDSTLMIGMPFWFYFMSIYSFMLLFYVFCSLFHVRCDWVEKSLGNCWHVSHWKAR